VNQRSVNLIAGRTAIYEENRAEYPYLLRICYSLYRFLASNDEWHSVP